MKTSSYTTVLHHTHTHSHTVLFCCSSLPTCDIVCVCVFSVQYRIFLASALQWLGLSGPLVRRIGNRRVSVSTMAILKEPLLNTHFDDSFEVYIYMRDGVELPLA